jgi:hypothetical protein
LELTRIENDAAGGALGSDVCRWEAPRAELERIPTVMVRIIRARPAIREGSVHR